MARIVDGPEITGQVVHKQTGQAYGPVTVTVSPKVYTDREMSASVTSLTTDGQGVFSCYAPPGVYTFTTTAADAGTLEPVEVLGREGGTGGVTGNAASLAVKDEGTTVVATASAMNFVGAGVTASDGGSGTATVTIPGASNLETVQTITATTATTNVPVPAGGKARLLLNTSTTVAVTGTPSAGTGWSVTCFVIQGGAGSFTPTFSGGVWVTPGGTPPTWSTAVGACDIVNIDSDGTQVRFIYGGSSSA